MIHLWPGWRVLGRDFGASPCAPSSGRVPVRRDEFRFVFKSLLHKDGTSRRVFLSRTRLSRPDPASNIPGRSPPLARRHAWCSTAPATRPRPHPIRAAGLNTNGRVICDATSTSSPPNCTRKDSELLGAPAARPPRSTARSVSPSSGSATTWASPTAASSRSSRATTGQLCPSWTRLRKTVSSVNLRCCRSASSPCGWPTSTSGVWPRTSSRSSSSTSGRPSPRRTGISWRPPRPRHSRPTSTPSSPCSLRSCKVRQGQLAMRRQYPDRARADGPVDVTEGIDDEVADEVGDPDRA